MSSTEGSIKDNPCGGKVGKARKEASTNNIMDRTNQQETDAQGFDEDGPHWRLRPLLQSLSGLPTLAKLGKSYPPNCLWKKKTETRQKIKPLRLNVQALHFTS